MILMILMIIAIMMIILRKDDNGIKIIVKAPSETGLMTFSYEWELCKETVANMESEIKIEI